MKSVFCLIMICLSFFSCLKAKLSQEELKSYIADEANGLHKTTEKNDIKIEAFYQPAEMVWAKEFQSTKSDRTKEELSRSMDTLAYFVLHFSRNGKEIENAYVSDQAYFTSLVNYLSFDISKDLFIVNGRDTVHALDAVYSRTFGASTSTSVMAIFIDNLKSQRGQIKLCFDDTMMDTGLSEFTFETDAIKNAPTLTFN